MDEILIQSPCRGCHSEKRDKNICARDCKQIAKYQERAARSTCLGSALSGDIFFVTPATSTRRKPHL